MGTFALSWIREAALAGGFVAALATSVATFGSCASYFQSAPSDDTNVPRALAQNVRSVDDAVAVLPQFTPGGARANPFDRVRGIQNFARAKFYHGYSQYTFCENWVANLSGYVWDHLRAKISPEDILDHPWAGCSQQGLVVQELLKRSGFEYATFGMPPPFPHFASAVKIRGTWYFVDSWGPLPRGRDRLIPMDQLLSGKGLEADFVGSKGAEFIAALQDNQGYMRSTNSFPASRGIFFQRTASFLSRFGWLYLFLIALGCHILIRSRDRRSGIDKRLAMSGRSILIPVQSETS